MDKIINIIIVFYVIKVVYNAIMKFGKQQQEQIKQRNKFELEDRKEDSSVIKCARETQPVISSKPPPLKRIRESMDSAEHIEEDTFTLDLAQGIIMGEILNPPLSRRRHFGAFGQRG